MSQTENLVMIHGLLGSLLFFDPKKYLLGVNIFLPDMYCYGQSPCLDNLSLENQADYLEKFIISNIKEPTWILGHSVGGAIAIILAARNPKIIKGIINVEGNFSLNDAFWSQSIAKSSYASWKQTYTEICSNPKKWLAESNIEITAEREKWAEEILAYQTALAVQLVSKAVVAETSTEHYQELLARVIDNKTPIHLLAGEFSQENWGIPKACLESAASFTIMQNAGHMMMLEYPQEFCATLKNIILSS